MSAKAKGVLSTLFMFLLKVNINELFFASSTLSHSQSNRTINAGRGNEFETQGENTV